MGYFDGLADGCFKQDESGQRSFYPNGILGKGYIVSDEQYQKIRSNIKSFFMIFLLTMPPLVVVMGWQVGALLLVALFILYPFVLKSWLKDAPVSANKLAFKESAANSARSSGITTLVILEIFGVLLFIDACVALTKGNAAAGLAGVLFFGFCTCAVGYKIFVHLKEKTTARKQP